MTDPLLLGRRTFVSGAAAATTLLATAPAQAAARLAATARSFPHGFRWGCATAGHQIEGNDTASDLWLLENVTPTAFAERAGDACDGYDRYEEDIALLARLGLNTYRFSIEWSRIEPDRGAFSIAELDHYRRVIACCRRHGVDPAVTFLHVAAPRWFAQMGAWLHPDSPALFARFCSVAAKALAADMAYAFTINEPQVAKTFRVMPAAAAYFTRADVKERAAHAAAAKATGSDRFVTLNTPDIAGMTPQLIAAHEQGFAAIKAERSALPVGVTLNLIDFQPATDDSPYRDVRRAAYGEWFDSVRRAGDFTAIQVYRQVRLPGRGRPLPPPPPLPFVNPTDMIANLAQPSALGNAATLAWEQTGKPIFVTENGIETDDDARRIWYIDAALASLRDSMAAGVPVIGYLHWSLLDNFEWEQGFRPKFGLVAVDRASFVRTPKPSAAHYGRIARRNAI